MYSVQFTEKAAMFLRKLPKEESTLILKKIHQIRNNPIPHLKKLKASKFWRLRISSYRAIIDLIISGRQMIVLRIGKRENVYA